MSAALAFDPDIPNAGFYRMRLRRGSTWSAVRIWNGPPIDPETGEEMDRAYRWQASINGERVELECVWPRCAADGIDEQEHDYLIERQRWGALHDPDGPDANPSQRIDPLRAPIPF